MFLNTISEVFVVALDNNNVRLEDKTGAWFFDYTITNMSNESKAVFKKLKQLGVPVKISFYLDIPDSITLLTQLDAMEEKKAL